MESDITFILNNKLVRNKLNPSIVLLDFIRKNKKLTGTKEVCKEGDCGACAVLLGEYKNNLLTYKTINSCLFPISKVSGKHIVTIEGLNQSSLSPIQKAFSENGASQCGFCTPGFIISITGYLLNNPKFILEDAINAIAGNICRCTGYQSIKKSLIDLIEENENISLDLLIKKQIIPPYFSSINENLINISSGDKFNEDKNNNFQYLSGGTDLFVQKPDELLKTHIQLVENIIDPTISKVENYIIISGSSTVEDLKNYLENHDTNLNLNKLFRLFASHPIRNSATLAGNIINASPIADLTIVLLALEAEVHLINAKGEKRIISLKKLFFGYKTLTKTEDEIIENIVFAEPSKNSLFNFEKVSKRTHLDIASVNSAIKLTLDGGKIRTASISAGGISPIPLYLEKTSEFLANSLISDDLVLNSIKIALSEIVPISDIRGTKEYKTLLLSQLIKAHFLELFPELITSEILHE